MGKLTTHVLDTANGCPAAGLAVRLYRDGDLAAPLVELHTNNDGRVDHPLLDGTTMAVGVYELVFEAGDYFRARGTTMPEPPFVDRVVIRFGIASAEQSYHVPLLVSPWSYSTYRGS
ncbi:hydroxyisourate hydrolase [Solimonas marina]|uniref:5-hydroxyisourate hydrolase n=1 Tax=Solimonas marina TaxID=2714601 RepID=A0A970B6A6_9GAMM|nr:hydroxyisourate hydrolase [Solimonas marina]NKF24247.1 hydroxyisourate hydrolase [Solimonas marina]